MFMLPIVWQVGKASFGLVGGNIQQPESFIHELRVTS